MSQRLSSVTPFLPQKRTQRATFGSQSNMQTFPGSQSSVSEPGVQNSPRFLVPGATHFSIVPTSVQRPQSQPPWQTGSHSAPSVGVQSGATCGDDAAHLGGGPCLHVPLAAQ